MINFVMIKMHIFQGNDPVWRGYLYTIILSIAAFVGAMSDSQYWYSMRMVGLRLQTAISTAIYKKSLVLSSVSRRKKTGKIT
jgi:ATP-binding cassette subfamily C (CFTR/MRP) protein 1